MNASDQHDLRQLLDALCEGAIDAAGIAELDALARDSHETRQLLIEYLELDGHLRWEFGAGLEGGGHSPSGEVTDERAEGRTGEWSITTGRPSARARTSSSAFGSQRPVLGFLGRTTAALNRPVFWSVLAVAAAFYGVFALISWDLRSGTLPSGTDGNDFAVAMVKGTSNLRWSEDDKPKPENSTIRSGEPLRIESGIVELQLKQGATLLVEGPAEWSIDGDNQAVLKRGKLLATVPPRAIGFRIETATATIVDLGTEFGVVADREGKTDVHVLRGSVEVKQSRLDATKTRSVVRLNAGDAVRVSAGQRASTILFNGLQFASTLKSVVQSNDTAPTASVDLADIIAGGDGRQHRRNLGIDPTNGQVLEMHRNDYSRFDYVRGDGLYHNTPNRPFVDGVAVVDATSGPVQLDSAGHAFDQFLTKDGRAYGPVWPGGALPEPRGDGAISSTFDGKFDYADAPHGFIALVPNKLITFDLDAIRRAYPGCSLTAFRSVAGNTKAGWSRTDIWVFVDGTLCFDRRGIKGNEGPQTIDVALSPAAKFLTLVATDGGDTPHFDHVIFGDPRIELTKNP